MRALEKVSSNLVNGLVDEVISPASGLSFDGANDFAYAPLNSAALSTGQCTGECWIKINQGPSEASTIMSPGGFSNALALLPSGNEVVPAVVLRQEDGSDILVMGTTTLPLDSWHHIAFSADGYYVHLYVDGVEAASPVSYDGTLQTTQNIVLLGALFGDFGFNGTMDEVRLWNKGLSASEIQAKMNCQLTGNEPGLMAYYQFNQGILNSNNSTETTATDLSSNGNHAILQGFALNGATSNWAAGTVANVSCAMVNTYYADRQREEFRK